MSLRWVKELADGLTLFQGRRKRSFGFKYCIDSGTALLSYESLKEERFLQSRESRVLFWTCHVWYACQINRQKRGVGRWICEAGVLERGEVEDIHSWLCDIYIVFELWDLNCKDPFQKNGALWLDNHSILGKNMDYVLRVTQADDCSPGLAERLKAQWVFTENSLWHNIRFKKQQNRLSYKLSQTESRLNHYKA